MPQTPADQLFVVLYDELHRVADSQLRRLGNDLSLGTTSLLHQAYLNLAGRDDLDFPDEARFLAYAARAMRSLVIDYARRGLAKKRGAGEFEITLTDPMVATPRAPIDEATELARLSDALDELAQLDPGLAQLVDLHFFCGYTFAEVAGYRRVTERTVYRDWRKARLLLQHSLEGSD